jgi:hypothetical protein
MNSNHPPFHDRLGPLPAENFDKDFAPDRPATKKAKLTPEQSRVLAQVMAANPTLIEEEALAELLAHGL